MRTFSDPKRVIEIIDDIVEMKTDTGKERIKAIRNVLKRHKVNRIQVSKDCDFMKELEKI